MTADKDGEMYSGGYTGKVLRVDLTNKTYSEEPLPVETARDFIGGAGFTVKYLFDEVPGRLRPARPGEQADLRARGRSPARRSPAPAAWPINAKSPADRRHGRRPHRRPLPGGDEARRLRRHHRRGRRRRAHLAVDQGRQGQLPLRQGALGHAEHRRPAGHQGRTARPEHAHLLHRPGRREALAHGLHRQRAPGGRPQGPRRRHGRQEPQGHRPARRRSSRPSPTTRSSRRRASACSTA